MHMSGFLKTAIVNYFSRKDQEYLVMNSSIVRYIVHSVYFHFLIDS